MSINAQKAHVASDGAHVQDRLRARAAWTRWSIVAAAVLAISAGALWLYVLGARTIVPTDEGRYAEIAREMAAGGDFITPRLNGIRYFGKPPLQAWVTALAFDVFGVGQWQARLWTGVCGLLGIAMVGYAGYRVFGAIVGAVAAAVLASSLFWIAAAHVSSYDMGLAAMMTAALCALLLAQRDGAGASSRRRWMLTCWTAMALAVLQKGPIGALLPAGVLTLYSLLARDRTIWRRLHAVAGLVLFLAITLPWFLLMTRENPEFAHFFFIREHLQRFTSDVHHRTQPWHYFVPYLAMGIMPWLTVLPSSLWDAARRSRARAGETFAPDRLLLAWVVFIFLFFSASRGKLAVYILPVFPALALLIARRLASTSHRTLMSAGVLLATAAAVGLGVSARFPSHADNAYELPLYRAAAFWTASAAAVGLAGGVATMLCARRRPGCAVAALAIAGALAGNLLLLGHEPLGRYKAGVDHLPAIRAVLTPETPIYAVGGYEYALPFYLERTVILVESAEDGMRLGLELEPDLWLPERSAFMQQWHALHAVGRRAVAILRPDIFQALETQGLPMSVIAADPRRVIVTNGM